MTIDDHVYIPTTGPQFQLYTHHKKCKLIIFRFGLVSNSANPANGFVISSSSLFLIIKVRTQYADSKPSFYADWKQGHVHNDRTSNGCIQVHSSMVSCCDKERSVYVAVPVYFCASVTLLRKES